MKLFPAIDLRGGKVVRLFKGDFGNETVYGDEPMDVAKGFADAGAPWIHVVDLDAARTGETRNRFLISAIAQTVDVPVQCGGGVRDRMSAEKLLDTGVDRIVIGTAAAEEPGLVEWLAQKYPGRIAVGVDARDGNVATRGWERASNTTALDLVRRYTNSGVSAFIVTDINRDGTQTGPDIDGLSDVLAVTDVDVIASGGVGDLGHLRQLTAINVGGYKRPAGVIVGRALYENKFSVADALAVLQGEE